MILTHFHHSLLSNLKMQFVHGTDSSKSTQSSHIPVNTQLTHGDPIIAKPKKKKFSIDGVIKIQLWADLRYDVEITKLLLPARARSFVNACATAYKVTYTPVNIPRCRWTQAAYAAYTNPQVARCAASVISRGERRLLMTDRR